VERLNPRLEMLFEKIRNEINIIKLENRLKKRVKKQMEKTQKDYYLNEQMRAIQKEMGTKDDFKAELASSKRRSSERGSPRKPTGGSGRSSRS
jgi:ATP-dependent Lon protease